MRERRRKHDDVHTPFGGRGRRADPGRAVQLTAKQKALLQDLNGANWLTVGDLSPGEQATGTSLHKRGLCEWKIPHDATENRHRRLHITDAGRKALGLSN